MPPALSVSLLQQGAWQRGEARDKSSDLHMGAWVVEQGEGAHFPQEVRGRKKAFIWQPGPSDGQQVISGCIVAETVPSAVRSSASIV